MNLTVHMWTVKGKIEGCSEGAERVLLQIEKEVLSCSVGSMAWMLAEVKDFVSWGKQIVIFEYFWCFFGGVKMRIMGGDGVW